MVHLIVPKLPQKKFSPQVTSKKNLPQNTSEKSVLKLPLKKFALLEEFDPIFPYQPTRWQRETWNMKSGHCLLKIENIWWLVDLEDHQTNLPLASLVSFCFLIFQFYDSSLGLHRPQLGCGPSVYSTVCILQKKRRRIKISISKVCIIIKSYMF